MYQTISHFIRITIFLFLVVTSSFSQDNSSLSKLEEYIETARINWEIPGLAIAIVKNDTVILEKGFGVKEYNKPGKVDEHTIFAIASNTKAFTVSCLAILNDNHLLSWDDKVIDHIPGFTLYDPFVTREATIRDLVSHRIGYKTFQGDLLWYASNHNRDEIINRLKYIKPEYSFRSRYGYSNLMFLVAGEIIPAVTRISWDKFVTDSIFIPLSMDRSFTSLTQIENIDNIATPHFVEKNSKTYIVDYINWDNIAPAGSILSNVHDLSSWLKFQLNNGKVDDVIIESEANIFETRQINTPNDIIRSQQYLWPSTHFKGYGMGWQLKDYRGRKIVSHGGGAEGMISKTVLVPEENLGIVILTNSINYLPSALEYYLLDFFMGENTIDWSKMYLDWETRGKISDAEKWKQFISGKQKNAAPSLELTDYTGIYTDIMYGDTKISLKKDQLYLEMLPTSIYQGKLEHFQFNTFLIKFDDVPSLPQGTVHFTMDKNGKVDKLKIDINNPDFDFTELDFMKQD